MDMGAVEVEERGGKEERGCKRMRRGTDAGRGNDLLSFFIYREVNGEHAHAHAHAHTLKKKKKKRLVLLYGTYLQLQFHA